MHIKRIGGTCLIALLALVAHAVTADADRYCIVDLSGGQYSSYYPVSYTNEIPCGHWSDDYKAEKLVLRKIEPTEFMFDGTNEVAITKPYYIGVFELTARQFELITGFVASNAQGDTFPAADVLWSEVRGDPQVYNWPSRLDVDADSIAGRLQARTGLAFDLPTEVQWECACLAGSTNGYCDGISSEADLVNYARVAGNLLDKRGRGYSTAAVGSFKPNAWGLYDMHGNVFEWCLDDYKETAKDRARGVCEVVNL